MLKKRDLIKNLLSKHQDCIICPICNSNIEIVNYSLKCLNNHNFDISKKGNIILYRTSKIKEDKIYDTELFVNRRRFILEGFYYQMHNIVSKLINDNFQTEAVILDMGCGEGTHDILIREKLKLESKIIGIDLSKSAIELSTDYAYDNFIPILSDLNRLPIADNTIDVILNILSPSNAAEMKRVLKENGVIIKVTPHTDYLKELRELSNMSEYSNESQLEENIKSNFEVIKKHEIYKIYDLKISDFTLLSKMTPLLKNKEIQENTKKITIALNIFLLKPKK